MTMVYDYVSGVKTAAVKSYISATGDTNTPWNISVGDVGDTAAISFQNGNFTLVLPTMPLDGRLTRQEVERLTGYWIHEVLGHAVQTDFKAWDEALRLGISQELNVVEDVRIERDIVRNSHYPNAKHYLETLVESIAYKAARDGFDWNNPKSMLSGIAYLGRTEMLGYKAPSLPALSTLSAPMQNALKTIFAEIAKCRSGKAGTWDALEIAKRLKQALQQVKQQQPQQGQGQGQQGQGQSDGQQQQQAGKGEGQQGDSSGDKKGDSAKGQGQSDGSQAGEKDAKDGSGKGAGDAFDAPLDTKPNDIAKRFGMSKKAKDLETRQRQIAPSIISSWVGEVERKMPIHSDPDLLRLLANRGQDYQGLKTLLLGSAKLRLDIKNFVSAPERVSFERYLEAGRLDTRLAAKMRAGSPRVFKRRLEDEGQNAAVMLLTDCSPSMRGGQDEAAAVLAIHMAEAIEQAGSPVSVAAFWDRTQGADSHVKIAKPFNKRVRACAWEMAMLAHLKSSGTNMSPAILQCAKKLKAVNATRHILFVLTDGECKHHHAVTFECAKLAEAMGVEVIGFGVGCDVSNAFPHSVRVSTDMSAIARTGLSVLAKQLKGKRAA